MADITKRRYLYFKRIFDIVFSLFGIILLFPLFIITAIVIILDSPGRIIYTQKRVGINGREFSFYKFRSMVPGAEKLKENLMHLDEAVGPVFKIKNDPRITSIGRFLRKYSIDELPQLFNVLRGDMSLVGPRPPLPEEVKQYTHRQMRRLSVVPGITCLWQVSGRNNVSFYEWIELDIYYIEHRSFLLDLKILIRTMPVVITGEGAC